MTDSEFVAAWLEETDEQLRLLTDVIRHWTNSPADPSHATEALRLIHAMEGAAGILRMENLLSATRHLGSEAERIRKNSSPALLNPYVEFLQTCNDRLRRGESLASATELVEQMQRTGQTDESA